VDLDKLSLTDAIKAVATGHVRLKSDAAEPPPEPSLTQAMKEVASRKRNPPTTRAGRKGIVIYVDQDVAAAIRRLASEMNTTVQALGTTAFDLLLEKFGEPRPG
jgi:antitoxin-like ribbon-helix-helix protein